MGHYSVQTDNKTLTVSNTLLSCERPVIRRKFTHCFKHKLDATLNWIVFAVLPPDAFSWHNSAEARSHMTHKLESLTHLTVIIKSAISRQEIVEFYKQSVATGRQYFKEIYFKVTPFIEIKLWRIVCLFVVFRPTR